LKQYSQMKDSGVSWIGEIPKNWNVKKIKYSVIHRTLKSKTNNQLSYVGLENVESKTGKLLDKNNDMAESDGKLFFKNDVLFGKLRPYLSKVTKIDFDGYCSSEFLVLCGVDYISSFLQFLIISHGAISEIDASTYGSKMPRAEWGFIGNMKFPLISKKIQTQIVTYLEEKIIHMDNEISKNEKLIKLLTEQKHSLIDHVVTKGLDDSVPMKDSEIPGIGKIPKHWKSARFKFLTDRVIVGIAESSTNSYVDKGIPLIRSTNIRDNYFRKDNLIFIDNKFAKKNFSKSLREHDILTVRTGYPGVSALISKEFDGAQCFTLLISTPSKSQSSKFLCYCLNSNFSKSFFKVEGWGAAQINISVPILQNLPLFEPPYVEQKQIADHIDKKLKKIDLLISKIELQVTQLREFRKSLISSAVTGKIQVAQT